MSQPDRRPRLADRHQPKPALGGVRNSRVRPAIVCPDHGSALVSDNFVEQPHLGGEIILHGRMIIEMIAAEVGEGTRRNGDALIAILRQTVAGCLIGQMRDAFARQPAGIREESDDIRRGKTGGRSVVTAGHAESPDRGGRVACHTPELAGHLDH